jgi:hypothetical protein
VNVPEVDWRTPWFAPWRVVGEPVLDACRTQALHQALGRAGLVRFVAQQGLPEGEAYESFVFRTRTVPTRDNAHDFFNGLAWLRFPDLKLRLNEIQAAELARDGVQGRRGPVRDAITLLDENGAFLDAPAALLDALKSREWKRLFIDLREDWRDARVTVFGHAMLEKLLAPRKDLTAHVWLGPALIDANALAAKPFAPLPLMGIPGWCAENQNFSFYDDSLVFRAAGHRTKHK